MRNPRIRVDQNGKVTLRYQSRLHHIGIGRAHKGRQIKLLIADRNIRIIDPESGELLRALTVDPTRDYQPSDKPQTVHNDPLHPSTMSRDTTQWTLPG